MTHDEILDRVKALVDEMHAPMGYCPSDILHGLERLLEDLESKEEADDN